MTLNEGEYNSRPLRWTAFALGIPLLFIFAFNYSSIQIEMLGISLKKIDVVDSTKTEDNKYYQAGHFRVHNLVDSGLQWICDMNTTQADTCFTGTFSLQKTNASSSSQDTIISTPQKKDSNAKNYILYLPDTSSNPQLTKSDTNAQRIILMGDSEAGGLLSVFNDYCVENGHTLAATMTWYSATIFNYGYSNYVEEFINQYQPTLIVVVIGLNELHARDLGKRTEAANLLKNKFNNIPYLWIGPANYAEDKGINSVFEKTATTERYVVSKNLNLPKGEDQRHPNSAGYKIWMRHIAQFIQDSELYDFKFENPKKYGHRITGKVVHYNAAKDRGY